ncbi:MAG: tRNA uridine-5-carboxymethylaminomethyl(34) synthesis GTPase MnmE [Lachnospiraceae bacterium]|nr:tRNA uridine-5-carboxymethylaminomethyl(34) synthesis GTPase MnmE [Lachnospiraceae bacterium]
MEKNDTIAAIATGLSPAGIGIIRISGSQAFNIAEEIFKGKNGKSKSVSSYPTHTVHYGFIHDGNELIDEVMLLIMRSPKSYTTENTVELQCHGGVFSLKRVLKTVLKHGARLAEPGEFTKRAFLNGRIDLSQSEAVMDFISSENEFARKNSLFALKGALSEKIEALREKIVHESAWIESAIDDPEHYSLENYSENLENKLTGFMEEIDALYRSFETGKIMQEGIKVSIVGRPNTGKSSLFNALTGVEDAIVTDIPGTTRDLITTRVSYQGITLNFTDTAGIHDTKDPVETIGIARSKKALDEADLVLFVTDASEDLEKEDMELADMLSGKRTILVLNKIDIEQKVKEEAFEEHIFSGSVPVSAKTGEGINALLELIFLLFIGGTLPKGEEIVITRERQAGALLRANESLGQVKKSIELKMTEDFFTSDLMDAYRALGEIIGVETGDDLADTIFRDFCMGK